ncbi:glmZ(sRNA)-inactivating NTPase [Anaerobiospirillum thomasii]|uniref:GlmZ(SRNA)-inactivating NTPase n=1 Tax=Anaerobiospirillum thomasii TaxID=179995 RepID=A0A2X0V8I7_9GAMM|nr:glmZ(sRNA)-inactivating NTPase [Anaerobiospirillum thomasii]SPT72333.1 glmZ(sRNA)-inactivating NTPase [Anaerobiospirillum thomasii]
MNRNSAEDKINLVIISGRSGSGKSVALKVLEDLGYYCIDNLPVMFLKTLVDMAKHKYPKLAVSIDIRNIPDNLQSLHTLYEDIKNKDDIISTVIYVDAENQVLLKRYSETRRLHPLSKQHLSLDEAIVKESVILKELASWADLRIDTTNMSIHDLSTRITTLILGCPEKQLIIVFESFGFKNGIAKDADFVFDARFLPNPFWDKNLRQFTGLDEPVIEFFKRYDKVASYIDQIDNLLMSNLEDIEKNNRSYLTVAIGCTGGKHRSVYVANELASRFIERKLFVQIRHCSLEVGHL